MNSLSWLIYAAEILQNVRGFLILVTIAGAVGVGMVTLFTALEDESAVRAAPFFRRYFWIPIVSGLVAAMLPSSTTVYLIAASEAGEAVVTNPDTIEMMGDLKAIIKKRLKEELAE